MPRPSVARCSMPVRSRMRGYTSHGGHKTEANRGSRDPHSSAPTSRSIASHPARVLPRSSMSEPRSGSSPQATRSGSSTATCGRACMRTGRCPAANAAYRRAGSQSRQRLDGRQRLYPCELYRSRSGDEQPLRLSGPGRKPLQLHVHWCRPAHPRLTNRPAAGHSCRNTGRRKRWRTRLQRPHPRPRRAGH
jgi:hypothetical protein